MVLLANLNSRSRLLYAVARLSAQNLVIPG